MRVLMFVGMTRYHKKDPSFHSYHPSVSPLCMSKGRKMQPSVEVGRTEMGWNEIKPLDDILPCAMATNMIDTRQYKGVTFDTCSN